MYATVSSADVRFANSTMDVHGTIRRMLLFGGTIWVIPGRTRHSLDKCAKTIGHTLGLPDVYCSIRELVASFPYK
jgi:hypothetical protein